MSKYYKTTGCVLAVDSTIEWRGDTVIVLRVAHTVPNHHKPLGLTTNSPKGIDRLYTEATMEEWLEAQTISEKRQEELDKYEADRAEAKRYGVAVTRHRRSYYESERGPVEPDVIVRCTKTRWVGLLGSYKRTVNYGQLGEMIRDRCYSSSSSTWLDANSLEHLAKMARGRLVVDFVKEAKKAEVKAAKEFKLRGASK